MGGMVCSYSQVMSSLSSFTVMDNWFLSKPYMATHSLAKGSYLWISGTHVALAPLGVHLEVH